MTETQVRVDAIVVDDIRYPVDLTAVTAEQVVWMRRDLAVSPIEMIARLEVSAAELPEVVALMALSREQAGKKRRLSTLLQQVTLSSAVDIETTTVD